MRLLEDSPIALPRSDVTQDLRLRLRAEGRVVDLPQGKTTIGSSARCDLRLQQPGVQPLHCLIMHEAEGLSVRRWGGDTLLNGEPFDESALAPGDCLRIASIEIEVVAATSAPPSMNPTIAPLPTTEENPADQLCVSRDLARTRSRKLLAALRRERVAHELGLAERMADLERQIEQAAADRAQFVDDHHQALAELADARQQTVVAHSALVDHQELTEENERLGGDVRNLVHQVDQLTRELESAAAAKQDLLDQKAAFAEQYQRLLDENSQRVDHEAELTHQIATLGGERDQLRDQYERLQAESQAIAAEQAALAAEHSELCGERDELRGQIDGLRSELQAVAAEQAALADERAALCTERDRSREENGQLQAGIAQLDEEILALTTAKVALEEERDRLREENRRLADVERQVRSAVADRENMSGELYRALLQAAEMQKHVAQYDALAAAHQSLNEQHAELTDRLARLQEQIDRFDEERAAAADARQLAAEEAAAAGRERQRLADENAELIASLTEARQQLDEAARQRSEAETRLQQTSETWREQLEALQRDHDAMAEKAARWERDLADKQQSEHASIADAERQIDAQLQQLADAAHSVQQLEQELAAARENHRVLEDERNEWHRQCSEATRQQEEQSTRIAELEAQVAAMAVAAPAENATSAAANWDEASPSAGGRLDGVTTAFPQQSDEFPGDAPAPYATESDWSAVPAESHDVDDPGTEDEAEPIVGPDAAEATAGAADPWYPKQETEHAPQPAPAVEAEGSNQPAAKPEPTSYIERYAHLFADEHPASEQPAEPAPSPRPAGGIEKSRRMNVVSRSTPAATPAASDGDEESIELYMSKLLQRVRGQRAGSPATTAQQTAAVPSGPLAYQQSQPGDPTAGAADEANPSIATKFTWANFDAARLKSQTAAPKTDLEALRALANESARRAISRHALRKHRRNALTKAIVSTLAGMTSLLLILQSPDWRSLYFITACVALLVAAYWAGQTYRALLGAFREKADDEIDGGMDNSVAGLQSPLPIDIDRPANLRDE